MILTKRDPAYHSMIRKILKNGPLSPRELFETVMLDESGSNTNKDFIQHALESFLGCKIPPDYSGTITIQWNWISVLLPGEEEPRYILLRDQYSYDD